MPVVWVTSWWSWVRVYNGRRGVCVICMKRRESKQHSGEKKVHNPHQV